MKKKQAEHGLKPMRLGAGLYKVVKHSRKHGSDFRVFIVENVSKDSGRKQWNISEQCINANNVMFRTEAFDACDTLVDAVNLIAGYDDEKPKTAGLAQDKKADLPEDVKRKLSLYERMRYALVQLHEAIDFSDPIGRDSFSMIPEEVNPAMSRAHKVLLDVLAFEKSAKENQQCSACGNTDSYSNSDCRNCGAIVS